MRKPHKEGSFITRKGAQMSGRNEYVMGIYFQAYTSVAVKADSLKEAEAKLKEMEVENNFSEEVRNSISAGDVELICEDLTEGDFSSLEEL